MVKTIAPVGYGELKSRKSSGAHYTPVDLADFVAKHILKSIEPGTAKQRTVLDPAVGDGELLAAIARQDSGKPLLLGYDIDLAAVNKATDTLVIKYPSNRINLEVKNFLEDIDTDQQGKLLGNSSEAIELVDVVIANPPYIRTQVLGTKQAKILANKYGLTGRVDIYHAFIAKIAEVLKPGGVAGVIVSNRFMYTQGGKSIRELILREFDVLHIWDFGDTKLFEAAVLPAVLILKKKSSRVEQASTRFTSIYTDSSASTSPTERDDNADVFSALESDGIVTIKGAQFIVSTGILHIDDGQPWRISEQSKDTWLNKVESNTTCYFEDISKVKVGVKTTADKVFIEGDWGIDEPELLVPLITHHIAHRYKSPIPRKRILYPYDMKSDKKTPVDINNFKNTASYLQRHKERLSSRTYVIEAGRKWYEIWVPHKPSVWQYPKIVFRDISEKPTFWVDFDGSIVNGDCYWMSLRHIDKKYIWLILAVANSSFIEKYYDYKFNNKLYSGRRRFISQYVNKFPLPDPNTDLAKRIITLAENRYKSDDASSGQKETLENELDNLVWQVFDVS